MLFAVSSHAALTLVSRETFQGVGTLNSGTPGNLGTVTGSFYKRTVGPKVSDDTTANGLGWSADFQGGQAYGIRSVSTGAISTKGMASVWCFLPSDATLNIQAGYRLWLIDVQQTQSLYNHISVGVGSSGKFNYAMIVATTSFQKTDSNISYPVNQWFEVRTAWETLGTPNSNTYRAGCYYRLGGSTTWNTIYENLSNTPYSGQAPNRAIFGNFSPDNGSIALKARYGLPSLYSMGAWADRFDAPSDVVDPPAGPFNWYVNPATGSDSNDGTSASSAWATVGKINTESANLGMFPTTAGMNNGDTLYLDGSTTPLVIGTSALRIQTQGLKFSVNGTEPIIPYTTITGTWALSSGSTKTYETTDNGATDLTSIVVVENWKILNHPNGSNFAAVQATLDATPGSFFCDGTKIYLHPFSDTNPSSDGKTYIRSRSRLDLFSSLGGSVITVNAPDVHITSTQAGGSLLRMSMLCRSSDGDAGGAYLLQWDTFGGGTNQVDNFIFDYGSKHLEGRTASASNMSVARVDCIYRQGSPYASFGGQTPMVDYCGGGTGNSYSYLRCTMPVNTGVPGSTTGGYNGSYPAWLSHGTASNNFQNGTFTDCNLCSSLQDQGVSSGITLLRCSVGWVDNNVSTTANQSTTPKGVFGTSNGVLTLRNCIMTIPAFNGSAYLANMPPTATIENCTIDSSAATGGGLKAIWRKTATTALTLRNCAYIGSLATADPRSLLTGFSNADTITMTNNAYQGYNNGATMYGCFSYNDGSATADRTLAQWQTLGFGAGSFTSADLKLNATTYYPLASSPVINAGTNVGPFADYSGFVYTTRNDIGSWEFLTPIEIWRKIYFNSPDNSGPGADTAITANDNLPNLLKYALGLNPLTPASALITSDTDSGHLRLTVQRDPRASDVVYSVEVTDDLTSDHWTTTDTFTEIDLPSELSVSDAIYTSDTATRFIRLRITRP